MRGAAVIHRADSTSKLFFLNVAMNCIGVSERPPRILIQFQSTDDCSKTALLAMDARANNAAVEIEILAPVDHPQIVSWSVGEALLMHSDQRLIEFMTLSEFPIIKRINERAKSDTGP